MARARIVYTFDPHTGRREWHVEYESDPDATGREHERAHARLVRAVVGMPLSADDVEVERETPEEGTEVGRAEELPPRGQGQTA